MERRYQVFISSTYADLVDERREVIQALLELDCFPAGMEMFPAADEDAWTLIERVIDACDYYVLIVGGRYGSISREGISYTEREYDYAVSRGIPVLAFLHANPDAIPAGRIEISEDAQLKLAEFREKVSKRLVRTYSSAHELGSAVSRSLIRTMRDRPGEGWVRGRHAMTPDITEEISTLRAKLAEAQLKQEKESHGSIDDAAFADLAQGDDNIELHFEIRNRYSDTKSFEVVTFTWNELIVIIGPALLNEATENVIGKRISDVIRSKFHEKMDADDRLTIDRAGFETIMVQLRALRIIEKGSKRRPISDKETYWALTKRGDEVLVSLKAVRRSSGVESS